MARFLDRSAALIMISVFLSFVGNPDPPRSPAAGR
jgi:hypothetical protein